MTGGRKCGIGLEVPCMYKIVGSEKLVQRMKSLTSSGGCTSLVQPVDVSFNKPFKSAVEQQATQHMQENLDSYVYGWINASARRVLITKWVGQAWEEISADKKMIIRSFKKCGISVPVDQIHIQGLEDYSVEEDDGDYTDGDLFSDGEDFGNDD